jgi:hypothetical protein
MSWEDEASAVRDKIDELAMRQANLDDWRLVDAQLFHTLVEAQQHVANEQRAMLQLARSSQPSWCWFEKQAKLLELRETMDDLRVLRMCVRSRIFELEAGAAQRYPAAP